GEVTAAAIGAEPVFGRGREPGLEHVRVVWVARHPEERKQGGGAHQSQHSERKSSARRAQKQPKSVGVSSGRAILAAHFLAHCSSTLSRGSMTRWATSTSAPSASI